MHIEEIYLQEGLSSATLTAYIPSIQKEGQLSKPAVIICPGGAFLGINEKEAEPVAMRFLSEGYIAFVLKYSIGEFAILPAPFIDLARAVILVRNNAARWDINKNKICICGFSSGGYVAAGFAATCHKDIIAEALNTDISLFKPNALILGYPLLDMKRFREKYQQAPSNMNTIIEMMYTCIYGTSEPENKQIEEWDVINHISTSMPPVFLWTTSEDAYIDIEGNLDFVRQLAKFQLVYEFHIFEKGAHGLSLCNRSTGYGEREKNSFGNTSDWVKLAINWLETAM